MLDYKALEALAAVIELQSFEAAALKLHITQSAVSQRIKGLETYYGAPLLIRMLPYKLTPLGSTLMSHYNQVSLLENALSNQLSSDWVKPTIAIALNRDSLETWFLDLIEKKSLFDQITLEVVADDQELTLDYFKRGLVTACLSTQEKAVAGGKVTFVGNMDYVMVASPAFYKEYFSKKNSPQQFLKAPAIKFDHNDKLHERYLEKFFGIDASEMHFHILPSVRGFKKYALLGYGYCLIPKIDIVEELKKKKLVLIYPEKVWQIPLYWHSWAIETYFYQKFNYEMTNYLKLKLQPENSND